MINLKNIRLSERAQTQDCILQDPIYMKCPEKADLWRQSRFAVAWILGWEQGLINCNQTQGISLG